MSRLAGEDRNSHRDPGAVPDPPLERTRGHPDVDLIVLLLREHDPRRSYDLHRDEWRFEARVLPGWDRLVRGRFLVPVEDEDRLREALARVAADGGFRTRAGVRSRELAERATPERWAEVVAQLAHRLVR